MKLTQCGIYLYLFIRFFTPLSTSFAQMPEIPIKHPAEQRIEDFINQKINTTIFSERTGYYKKDSTKLDTFIILAKSKTIAIHLDKQFAHAPFRPSTVAWLKKEAAIYLGELYENFSIELYSNNKTLETYIPNFYRETKREFDYSRIPKKLLQKLAYHIKINKNSKIIINSLFRTNC